MKWNEKKNCSEIFVELDRMLQISAEKKTQNLAREEAHDMTKTRKSTKWKGALSALPLDVLPSVDGTVLDPPPELTHVILLVYMSRSKLTLWQHNVADY